VTPGSERAFGAGAPAEARLRALAGRMTERDRLVCRLLFEHRVLTTRQVADVGFGHLRKAQERLVVLYRFEVVDRFRPRSWAGTGPYHFTLGPAGAAVVAAERGVEVAALGWRRDAAAGLATSQQLGHLVGVNGFFTALVRSARQGRASRLAVWWSERRCAAAWGEVARPDGYGVWAEASQRVPFLLEYDNGTERLARLAAKLAGYAELARAAGHPTWVLFRFPSAGREAAARRVLAHADVAVATAVLAPGAAPDAAVWLAVGDTGPRCRLGALGHPSRVLGLGPRR
jgi:hypothetical protein